MKTAGILLIATLALSLAAEAKPKPESFTLNVKVIEKSDTYIMMSRFDRLKILVGGKGYFARTIGFRGIPIVLGQTYPGRIDKKGKHTWLYLLVPDKNGVLKTPRLEIQGELVPTAADLQPSVDEGGPK